VAGGPLSPLEDSQHTVTMDFTALPRDLPVPSDDGSADHLAGLRIPSLSFDATDGSVVELSTLRGTSIVYVYPMTGIPGVGQPDGWDLIPGARGCTAEARDFRDHFAELRAAGASSVYGLSAQSTAYQRDAVDRLHLPFAMLSDVGLRLAGAIQLPLFEVGGMQLYKRITLVVRDGVIDHAFYPIFPPDTHARAVIDWLTTFRA
jgi:peroxiredoxin